MLLEYSKALIITVVIQRLQVVEMINNIKAFIINDLYDSSASFVKLSYLCSVGSCHVYLTSSVQSWSKQNGSDLCMFIEQLRVIAWDTKQWKLGVVWTGMFLEDKKNNLQLVQMQRQNSKFLIFWSCRLTVMLQCFPYNVN